MRGCVRPGFVALLCAGAYFGSVWLLGTFLAAAFCHELGHLLSARLMGRRVDSLTLSALGAELHISGVTAFWQDAVLTLSGPVVNLALATACAAWGVLPVFTGANLLLGAFNLLPIRPLDGGNAMYALLSLAIPAERAERVTAAVSKAFALSVALLGAWVLVQDRTKPCLLWVGLWLVWGAFSLSFSPGACNSRPFHIKWFGK